MSTTESTKTRIHGLDAVRAAALLLGIVLHGLMPYTAQIPWLVDDSQRAEWPLVVISAIHFFRMTLFLVLAGYFGRLVRSRRGTRSYLRDRLIRIVLPLFVFWPFAVLPLGLLAAWHASRVGKELVRPDVAGHGGVLGAFDLGHLWFLWVLAQCIVLALLLRWAATKLMPEPSATVRKFLMRCLSSPLGVLLAAIPYAITTNIQQEASGLIAPTTLMPDPVALVAYLGAFGVGWVLSSDDSALRRIGNHAWFHSAFAVVATALTLVTTGAISIGIDAPQPVWSTLQALAGWSCCYALLGLSVLYLNVYRPWVRYLADASYWMYLMHLVLLTFFEVLIANLAWPIMVKASLNFVVTSALLLFTYHVFVRSTWLGSWLNGRKSSPSSKA
ncbi:acyltransferase family protein [Corynebacterium sp. H128]|uniref:acyltransferase family protein n=1 Tax=Corynebacterium sp. H128 TaxID=3133427 RepID=UPI0030A39730